MANDRFEIEGVKHVYYTSENFPEVKTIRQAAADFAQRFQCQPTNINGHSVIGICENTSEFILQDDKYESYADGPHVLTEKHPQYDEEHD